MGATRHFLSRLLAGDATRDQARDTGMAVVLALLLLALAQHRSVFIVAAVAIHAVTMAAPDVYRPLAVLWLGFAEALGTVASTLLLSLVFFVVVTPIGWLRRRVGTDALRLRAFKTGRQSVMELRNHTFSGRDIERPY